MPHAYLPHVAGRVRAAIAQASDAPAFLKLLTELLARPGRVLASTGAPKWPTFVLATCEALGGDLEAGVEAAAAVELIAAAADVVDDLVDDEWDGAPDQWGRALNGSVALTLLAQRCASQLARRLGTERACRIADLIVDGSLAAYAGEDLDLLLETTTAVTEELAHEMTRRKSGSLVAMACQVGAAVATGDPAVLQLAGTFGGHVGIVAQLLNDLAGVDGDPTKRGSDLRRRKKTLPVAFALRCAREECIPTVGTWYEQCLVGADRDEDRLAATLHELGALHYTWVVAYVHRRQALATLRALMRESGRAEVRHLRRLVPELRASRPRHEPGR